MQAISYVPFKSHLGEPDSPTDTGMGCIATVLNRDGPNQSQIPDVHHLCDCRFVRRENNKAAGCSEFAVLLGYKVVRPSQ